MSTENEQPQPAKFAKPSQRSGVRLPVGAHPKNSGGKKGRSGRKPDEWKKFCGEILNDAKTRLAIRKAAKDPESRGFAMLIKLLAEDAGVKAPTPKEIRHVGKVVFEVRREGTDKKKAAGQ